MSTLKRYRLAAALTVITIAAVIACKTVDPGQDVVLVRAEQTYTQARDTFNFLFKVEADNKAQIETLLPGTHKIVDGVKVRVKGTCSYNPPPSPCSEGALPAMLAAIKKYETAKSAENADALTITSAVIGELLRSAQTVLAELSAKGIVKTSEIPVGPIDGQLLAIMFLPMLALAGFVMSPQIIMMLIGVAQALIEYIAKARKTAKQTSAWDAQGWKDVDAAWTEMVSSPHWQTDEEKGGG